MGVMRYLRCQRCGKRIRVSPNALNTKFCDGCRRERARERSRAEKARLKALKTRAVKTCRTCGREFTPGPQGGRAKVCPDCRANRTRRTLPPTRACEGCGTRIEVGPYQANLRFCPDCRAARDLTLDRESKARSRGQRAPRVLTCRVCGSEFEKTSGGRDPGACPDCRKVDYESRRPPRKRTREQTYEWRLARQYGGLTLPEREAMAARQGHKCYLCGTTETPEGRLHVDHDHSCCPGPTTCGKCIRGLICGRCNRALGLINEDTGTLRKMLTYLKAGGAPHTPNRKRPRK